MNPYREWSKSELHLHLEGSVSPETLCALDPTLSLAAARDLYRFHGFPGFIEAYKAVAARLRTPESYALITRGLLARLAAQNVAYAEVTVSAGVVLWQGLDFAPIYDAIRDAAAASPIEVHWILDAVRHFGADHAMQVAELAAARVAQGVIAFGIGGDETRGPASWFADVFRYARSAGLRLTAHAGETAGPASIWEALEIGAERIGHGIRAIDDPDLLAHLRDRNIPLEICISSNVATGAVESLAAHPVRRLYDAGVPITLNTDDPAMFSTDLSAEYALAAGQFGFTPEELRAIAANAFRFAFSAPSPAAAPPDPVPRR